MWAILQLRDVAPDHVPVTEIERDLRLRAPQLECRFPAVKQNLLDRENPLSSYVFVKLPEVSPTMPGVVLRVERSPYASRLLRDRETKRLQTVTDDELAAMVPATDLPPVGTPVRVTCGDWEGLEGVIVERNCQTVRALVELWSRQRILTLQPNEFQAA